MSRYIYQHSQWPQFTWDDNAIAAHLAKAKAGLKELDASVSSIGFRERDSTFLNTLTADVLKSSEIEGEMLNMEQVRSSVARHLGMDIAGLVPSDRHVDGIVEMMIDATRNADNLLTKQRLFTWHKGLFPSAAERRRIIVGKWRNDSTGPMQVVSGAMGREKVHYQAPVAKTLEKEMSKFLQWFNGNEPTDNLVKAAIAHLWFVTLHPFEDGNGRIARAIADMQLSKQGQGHRRFYSMSAQIRTERKAYYTILEKTQKGTMDITGWLIWFLSCLNSAVLQSVKTINRVVEKAAFWDRHNNTPVNERQRLMLNKLYDDFYGKLTTSKWAKMAKCSHDTALRDIKDLMDKAILKQEKAGGRSTGYVLK